MSPSFRLKAFCCNRFELPLPGSHRFPVRKYDLLEQRVRSAPLAFELIEATAARNDQLELAHTAEYVARVAGGTLSAQELRAIGFPWSPQMVERSRRSVGATIDACRTALREGVAVHLAGGTHHACADRGQGYCVFNDVAIAARVLQREHRMSDLRIAVIDLDVHQGNGTAAIFARDASVFTLSIHGASNFPFRKETSDLDVPLPDGTTDASYLQALDGALAELQRRFEPGLLVYVSGADAHEGDRLGRLELTTEGMRERDRRVFALAHRLDVPIAVTMAGGYGRDIGTTVEVHFNTVCAASEHHRRLRAEPARGGT